MNDKNIISSSLIHFLTNGISKYVRIKNIKTNKYLYVYDNKKHDDVNVFVPYAKNINKIFVKITGNISGTIFNIIPSHNHKNISIMFKNDIISEDTFKQLTDVEQKNNGQQDKCMYMSLDNTLLYVDHNENTELGITRNRGKNTLFYLGGSMENVKICLNFDEKNLYGGNGRYLYMTQDGHIHTDGDCMTEETNWIFELINAECNEIDIRDDYKKVNSDIKKNVKMNIENIFPSILKLFTIVNVKYKKYLNISINSENITQNRIFGSDNEQKFIIQPDIIESCVYISYYDRYKLFNIFVIPFSKDIYVGSPKCNWAKFSIIKKNNYYMFMCNKLSMDTNGKYGVYLSMTYNDDKFSINSNGGVDEDNSMWIVKN